MCQNYQENNREKFIKHVKCIKYVKFVKCIIQREIEIKSQFLKAFMSLSDLSTSDDAKKFTEEFRVKKTSAMILQKLISYRPYLKNRRDKSIRDYSPGDIIKIFTKYLEHETSFSEDRRLSPVPFHGRITSSIQHLRDVLSHKDDAKDNITQLFKIIVSVMCEHKYK